MTLVIGCKWFVGPHEAILMTSDSKVTTGMGVAFEMKKVHAIQLGDKPVALVGGAGQTALAKQGFEAAEEILLEYANQAYPVAHANFRVAVRQIEERLVARFSQLRGYGIQPQFEMILGSLDLQGVASLYRFDPSGLAEPVHDTPGYAIIGSGMVTGGILLLRMLGYEQDLELGRVSAFIIDSVSEVDTAVGPFIGESYLMRMTPGGGKTKRVALGPLTPQALTDYKDQIAARRSLIRKLWRLCDQHDEQKVQAALDAIEPSP
jgi:20S proteasome alpha/beta subunit